MQTRFDVVVIGAGPAGCTAAILLAQAGWSVALIEKQAYPRRKVCGECIAAPNLTLLDALGVGATFHALAGPELKQVALMSGGQMVLADLPALDADTPWGKALGREHLDSLLLERAKAAGATVLQPWTASAIHGTPGRFECMAAAADSLEKLVLTSTVIIAAYGSWQLSPPERGSKRLPRYAHDLFGFKASFSNGGLAPGLLPVLAFPGGYGGMVLGDHGITTLACCLRRDMLTDIRQRFQTHTAAEAVESHLRLSCLGVQQALQQAELQGPWLSIGPLRPGIRIRRHDHAFFLIGNAAGEAHPIIGEGISMAMQSAWILCERLIRNKHAVNDASRHESLRQRYVGDWMDNFASRIRLAAVFAHVAMRPLPTAALLPVLRRRPQLMTRAATLSGKTRPLDLSGLIPD